MTIKKIKKSSSMLFMEKISGGPLTFAALLDAIREGEELSNVEFADKLKISKSHLCDILKGRKSVSISRAIEFAEVLGYSKDQFVRLSLQMQVDQANLPYRVSIQAA